MWPTVMSVQPPPAEPPYCRCTPRRPTIFWRGRWWCNRNNALRGCGFEAIVPKQLTTPLCRCHPPRPAQLLMDRWWCANRVERAETEVCDIELPREMFEDTTTRRVEDTLLRRADCTQGVPATTTPADTTSDAPGPHSRHAPRHVCSGRHQPTEIEREAAMSTAAMLTASAYGPMNAACFIGPVNSEIPPPQMTPMESSSSDRLPDTHTHAGNAPTTTHTTVAPAAASAPSTSWEVSSGVGLFARCELAAGQAIGELCGPWVPRWLHDSHVDPLMALVPCWWLERPSKLQTGGTQHGGRSGRKAGSKGTGAAASSSQRDEGRAPTDLFVDGTRQFEQLLSSLTSAQPLLAPLAAVQAQALPIDTQPGRVEPARLEIGVGLPGQYVRWPATYVHRAAPYNAVVTAQPGRGPEQGRVRLWLVSDRDIKRGEEILVQPSASSTCGLDAPPRPNQLPRAKRLRAPACMTPPELGHDCVAKLQRLCFGVEDEDEEENIFAVGSDEDNDDSDVIGAEPPSFVYTSG